MGLMKKITSGNVASVINERAEKFKAEMEANNSAYDATYSELNLIPNNDVDALNKFALKNTMRLVMYNNMPIEQAIFITKDALCNSEKTVSIDVDAIIKSMLNTIFASIDNIPNQYQPKLEQSSQSSKPEAAQTQQKQDKKSKDSKPATEEQKQKKPKEKEGNKPSDSAPTEKKVEKETSNTIHVTPDAEPMAANKAFGFDPSVFINQPQQPVVPMQSVTPQQIAYSANDQNTMITEMLAEIKKRVISGKHTGNNGIGVPEIVALHWLINNPRFNAELQARGATNLILNEVVSNDDAFDFAFEVATPTNPITVKFSTKRTYKDPATGNVCYIYSIV